MINQECEDPPFAFGQVSEHMFPQC
jgi:hypothetical protein